MEVFSPFDYKFQVAKYRGNSTPVGRQAHAAVLMSQYAMVVIGGTYEHALIDPTPVPVDDSIWSFDTESGHWNKIKVKNQGTGTSGPMAAAQDVVPWNLVHHSAFKLDGQNIGVLWYDPEVLAGGQVRRNVMISTFNCKKSLWKNLKVAKYGDSMQSPLMNYRF